MGAGDVQELAGCVLGRLELGRGAGVGGAGVGSAAGGGAVGQVVGGRAGGSVVGVTAGVGARLRLRGVVSDGHFDEIFGFVGICMVFGCDEARGDGLILFE